MKKNIIVLSLGLVSVVANAQTVTSGSNSSSQTQSATSFNLQTQNTSTLDASYLSITQGRSYLRNTTDYQTNDNSVSTIFDSNVSAGSIMMKAEDMVNGINGVLEANVNNPNAPSVNLELYKNGTYNGDSAFYNPHMWLDVNTSGSSTTSSIGLINGVYPGTYSSSSGSAVSATGFVMGMSSTTWYGDLTMDAGTTFAAKNLTADAITAGSLSVTGNTTIGGTLSVTGSTTVSSLTASGNITSSGQVQGATLVSTGNTSVGNDLSVARDATVTRNLTVNGTTTLNSVTTSGNASVGGNLTVTGTTSLNGGASVSGGNLNMNSNKVTNLADGVSDGDAVNMNQLNALSTRVTTSSTQITNLTNQVQNNLTESRRGIASVSAMNGIPSLMGNSDANLGVGLGQYRGQSAVAIGGHAKLTNAVVFKTAIGVSGSDTTASLGLGVSF